MIQKPLQFKTIDESNFDLAMEIYKLGILTGHATFETEAPSWTYWDKKHYRFGRIAGYYDDNMVGWIGLYPSSSRQVYSGVGEVSIYLHPDYQGQGYGTLLMKEGIRVSEENDLWTLQSKIFPENEASLALHLKCGFRVVGYREKIAKHHDIWRDNLLLERRSTIIGI